MSEAAVGISVGSKPINLSQLETELAANGVNVNGLGLTEDQLFTYDTLGQPADFAAADGPVVTQTVTAHVALRDKTDAEYSAEFQDPATGAVRKQEIRDITAGLLPREKVPM